MCNRFEGWYLNSGLSAKRMYIITGASPCWKKCAGRLIDLANQWHNSIYEWNIYFLDIYHNQDYKKTEESLSWLNSYNDRPIINAKKLEW